MNERPRLPFPDAHRIGGNPDWSRVDRANALYEELRLLTPEEILVRWREATGLHDGHGRSQMIAEIIEYELAEAG